MSAPDRFSTDRLLVEDWQAVLQHPERASGFKSALATALTPAITRYLPLSMQFNQATDGVEDWIIARQQEAHVLSVHLGATGDFVGLVLLHEDKSNEASSFHIGYFFSEANWGRGYATEVLGGLVKAFQNSGSTTLLAGVDIDNAASARVLEKAGFSLVPDGTAKDRLFFECQIS